MYTSSRPLSRSMLQYCTDGNAAASLKRPVGFPSAWCFTVFRGPSPCITSSVHVVSLAVSTYIIITTTTTTIIIIIITTIVMYTYIYIIYTFTYMFTAIMCCRRTSWATVC